MTYMISTTSRQKFYNHTFTSSTTGVSAHGSSIQSDEKTDTDTKSTSVSISK